jgi:hypothetical protein
MRVLHFLFCFSTVLGSSHARSEDAWSYPKPSNGVSGELKHGDTSISTRWSREIDEEFDTVAKWYAEKLNATDLTTALEKYAKRAKDAPETTHGSCTAVTIGKPDAKLTSSITYFLNPRHKHVTILHPTATGGVIALSIAGTPERTTVQFAEKKAK